MRWPWQKKTSTQEREFIRPVSYGWYGLTREETFSWFARQPWAQDACDAWSEYWDGQVYHSPKTDDLARLRFMAAWARATEDETTSPVIVISLPFIGFERSRWLHFDQAYARHRFKHGPNR